MTKCSQKPKYCNTNNDCNTDYQYCFLSDPWAMGTCQNTCKYSSCSTLYDCFRCSGTNQFKCQQGAGSDFLSCIPNNE